MNTNKDTEARAVDIVPEKTTRKGLTGQEAEAATRIIRALASTADLSEAMREVNAALKAALDVDSVAVAMLEETGTSAKIFYCREGKNGYAFREGGSYPTEGSPVETVLREGTPLIPNEPEKPAWWLDPEATSIQASLLFPLAEEGKTVGTLIVASLKRGTFGRPALRFLSEVAPAVAVAFARKVRYEAIKDRVDEMTILYEMTRISTSSLSMDQMLSDMANHLNRFFRFESLGILLCDETGRKGFAETYLAGPPQEKIASLRASLAGGLPDQVVERGEPVAVSHSDGMSGQDVVRAEIGVPLKTSAGVIGVLHGRRREPGPFGPKEMGLLTIIVDRLTGIVESMRSEERYRTVVENALDGVMVLGEDGRFSYVNERLAEILGYGRDELAGFDFRRFLDEKSQHLLDEGPGLGSGEKAFLPHHELDILRKDGEVRHVELSSTTIRDPRGILNTIAFVKDVTEKRRMEEQLLQAEKLRALGEMASGVAHDFNNALAIILGNAQLLLLSPTDKETRETLQTIEKVARESAQTVRRLQDFTRKRPALELYKVDLNGLIREAVEITRPRWKDVAQEEGLEIQVNTDLNDVPAVTANASEMREVITNMIFNAVEAMPKGGRIEIRTERRKDRVAAAISDNGTGMAEEVRRKVFEPFFTTKPFTNTGLGLSMAYGIVRRLGGDIEVESQPGKGTTFRILLPVELEAPEEAVFPRASGAGKQARILVIDDEASMRVVLSKILSQAGHRVTVAESGEVGIRLFKEGSFDLVLTDLGMPGMSGWEVCRTLKTFSALIPVGMITGWGQELDSEKVAESGVDFILSKPFDFNQVLNIIAREMESRGKGAAWKSTNGES
jgi:PAS domain S-box-containing protein